MHFDPKKYITNYKMRLIQNKEDIISYYQLKKKGKKVGEAQKLGQSCQKREKLRKFCKKIGIICILTQKNT